MLAVAATHLEFSGRVLSFQPALLPSPEKTLGFFLYFPKRVAIACMITCCFPSGGLPSIKKSRAEEEGLGLSWAGLGCSSEGRRWGRNRRWGRDRS